MALEVVLDAAAASVVDDDLAVELAPVQVGEDLADRDDWVDGDPELARDVLDDTLEGVVAPRLRDAGFRMA